MPPLRRPRQSTSTTFPGQSSSGSLSRQNTQRSRQHPEPRWKKADKSRPAVSYPFVSDTRAEPAKVSIGSRRGGQHQEFRHVVGVQPQHFPFQRGEPGPRRLDNQQMFPRRFHFALPLINRLNRSEHHRNASRQSLANNRAGDSAPFEKRPARNQHHAYLPGCLHEHSSEDGRQPG